jgi:RNA polymerase sigma-70 factor, ECF subfamily
MEDPATPPGSHLFDAHWPAAQPIVKNYIVGLLGRRGAIDEVVQEVAYTCLRRIATFDQARSFTAWALGIARLEVFTHRRQQVLLSLGNFPELEAAMSDTQEILSDHEEKRRKALALCQERLSEQQRKFIDLYYKEDSSHDKMAEQLGMRSGTVKVALSRIRALLRQCVEHRLTGTGVS